MPLGYKDLIMRLLYLRNCALLSLYLLSKALWAGTSTIKFPPGSKSFRRRLQFLLVVLNMLEDFNANN
jgi:hypothetical protein